MDGEINVLSDLFNGWNAFINELIYTFVAT